MRKRDWVFFRQRKSIQPPCWTVAGVVLLALATAQAGGAIVTPAGASLASQQVPPPGSQGYVLYAFGSASGTKSATPIGLSSSGNLASPVPYVSIDTSGDKFYTESDSVEMYSTLAVNGVSAPTGVAYQAVGSVGNSAVLATITLGPGVPTIFRLGVLTDNAPQPQNDTATVEVTGQYAVSTPAAGNTTGSHDDFYFFDVSNAAPADLLTIRVTNGGSSSGFAYAELGGFTFDSVPEPTSAPLLLIGVTPFVLRKGHDSGRSGRNV